MQLWLPPAWILFGRYGWFIKQEILYTLYHLEVLSIARHPFDVRAVWWSAETFRGFCLWTMVWGDSVMSPDVTVIWSIPESWCTQKRQATTHTHSAICCRFLPIHRIQVYTKSWKVNSNWSTSFHLDVLRTHEVESRTYMLGLLCLQTLFVTLGITCSFSERASHRPWWELWHALSYCPDWSSTAPW